MKQLQILKHALKNHFPMNAARFHCLAGIILALLKVRTVNLAELADALKMDVHCLLASQNIKYSC